MTMETAPLSQDGDSKRPKRVETRPARPAKARFDDALGTPGADFWDDVKEILGKPPTKPYPKVETRRGIGKKKPVNPEFDLLAETGQEYDPSKRLGESIEEMQTRSRKPSLQERLREAVEPEPLSDQEEIRPDFALRAKLRAHAQETDAYVQGRREGIERRANPHRVTRANLEMVEPESRLPRVEGASLKDELPTDYSLADILNDIEKHGYRQRIKKEARLEDHPPLFSPRHRAEVEEDEPVSALNTEERIAFAHEQRKREEEEMKKADTLRQLATMTEHALQTAEAAPQEDAEEILQFGDEEEVEIPVHQMTRSEAAEVEARQQRQKEQQRVSDELDAFLAELDEADRRRTESKQQKRDEREREVTDAIDELAEQDYAKRFAEPGHPVSFEDMLKMTQRHATQNAVKKNFDALMKDLGEEEPKSPPKKKFRGTRT